MGKKILIAMKFYGNWSFIINVLNFSPERHIVLLSILYISGEEEEMRRNCEEAVTSRRFRKSGQVYSRDSIVTRALLAIGTFAKCDLSLNGKRSSQCPDTLANRRAGKSAVNISGRTFLSNDASASDGQTRACLSKLK